VRSSVLVCTAALLRAGETISVGPISVTGGARTLSGEWRVRTPGGFGALTGRLEPVKLTEEGKGP